MKKQILIIILGLTTLTSCKKDYYCVTTIYDTEFEAFYSLPYVNVTGTRQDIETYKTKEINIKSQYGYTDVECELY